MKIYSEFCSALTKQLFDVIEKNGSLLTWHKEWDGMGSLKLPVGAGGIYNGSNLLMLFFSQYEEGYKTNQWLTFNQIRLRGGCVKKGAKGQSVYFWKMLNSKKVIDGKEIAITTPLLKSYYVFNLDQTTLEESALDAPMFSADGIDSLVQSLGVTISYFGGRAYYNPVDDVIVLPEQKYFTSKQHYYAVLLHELVHWTGGRADRLPRECFDNYAHSEKDRAQEELIAEVGSLFLSSHFGLRAELEHHASYVQSWKTLLSEKEVMNAVNKASKAFAWILGFASESEVEKAA